MRTFLKVSLCSVLLLCAACRPSTSENASAKAMVRNSLPTVTLTAVPPTIAAVTQTATLPSTNTPPATATEVYQPVVCDLVAATPIPIQDQPASMIAAEEVYQNWLDAVGTWAQYDQGKQARTLVSHDKGLTVDRVVKDVLAAGKLKGVNATNVEFVPVEKGKADPAYVACARWSYPTGTLYCSETRLEKTAQEWKVTDWHWFVCDKQP
jgi:hypothetical protein